MLYRQSRSEVFPFPRMEGQVLVLVERKMFILADGQYDSEQEKGMRERLDLQACSTKLVPTLDTPFPPRMDTH